MDYQGCTLEQLADHVEKSSTQLITQQMIYYKKRDNFVMVEKIKEARKVVRKRKLIKLLASM